MIYCHLLSYSIITTRGQYRTMPTLAALNWSNIFRFGQTITKQKKKKPWNKCLTKRLSFYIFGNKTPPSTYGHCNITNLFPFLCSFTIWFSPVSGKPKAKCPGVSEKAKIESHQRLRTQLTTTFREWQATYMTCNKSWRVWLAAIKAYTWKNG